MPPRSPASIRSPFGNRRGSILSRVTSNDFGAELQYAAPSRANTVRTYHEPDHHNPNWQPGAEPGIDTSTDHEDLPHLLALKAACDINIIDFGVGDVVVTPATNETLEKALSEERPEDLPCRWVSVNGLSWDVVKLLGNKYELHRLAVEDLINTHSRTKVDWYKEHACMILTLQKLVRLHQNGEHEDCPASNHYQKHHQNEDGGPHLNHHHHRRRPKRNYWWTTPNPDDRPVLPYHLDRDGDGKVDETVRAHSGMSEDSPIKEIRTLHRYESSQIPAHTAFMEKHSALAAEDFVVSVEQVCIFLLNDNTVISFFEHSADDIEHPILKRLHSGETVLRQTSDASLLVQAIIDAVVDLALPVKEAYNKARKELQVDAMTNPNIRTSRALHIFGEEIDMLQNLFKPIVHLVNALRDHNSDAAGNWAEQPSTPQPIAATPGRERNGTPIFDRKISELRKTGMRKAQPVTNVTISPVAHVYFGDVLDHCISTIQAFEQMDASANNISTLIFNTVGAKTNNFMMILAVVTVFFAPLTFISGYFGQNFSNGNGLNHSFSFFWVVSVPSLVLFMLLVFATMLWDNIRDWLAKRGIRAHRRGRMYRNLS
ncbi:hypothetical protein K431DRAFT_231608 [Polychaeton citri CBS 116435]|uniref:Cora-domain-containing protein n=1 Tax=Polychaeton citri CBS 116435 TaxID=1314669 RepID=A0A9P4Q455_9PEZI|nr:hypothetical protein K431DRAFT_231608 [Polychaeton citri CBS 116435]